MIIRTYLLREIGKPLALMLAACMALFAGYSAADFLSDAVNGLLSTNTIVELIILKLLISLEVLVPVALYLSTVLALGTLYGNSEITALHALRVTPGMVLRHVLVLAGCVAIGVGILSLVVRPWAYDRLHALSRSAELSLDVDAMQPGTFYVVQNGGRVIFLTRRQGPNGAARDIFVQLRRPEDIRIIHAELGYPVPEDGGGHADLYVRLKNTHIYDIATRPGGHDQVMTAREITQDPNRHVVEAPDDSAVTTDSLRIASLHKPADVAEFQWRLSTPLTTLLLAMLAVPLARGRPRQNRYGKLGTAILIFFVYYLLYTSARTWVQHGRVPPIPGIWWAPGLLAILTAFMLREQIADLLSRRARAA
ncbi:LPS export ABC transporter permease LptF [Gluconacetobacter sacchari]|uniref:Lipopolysaccharide export system permease protein LptF n=2 Tax=Gluconacetobacter sacchari TaxID=92759 RepID=A0A7W4I9E3_9PROT|nr:LPS export ABC transporter permease LptF [Gluconacetobacter sacchari]MBB2158691.1 LPS export ABC transporter permease LptF [Gluconacetobacter sacchari]GBQ19011.1 YjgP/YjgQ family permease [Gluconacetobacter sacchari DSM 12717]